MPLIRRRVPPDEWKPIGVESLEDNALDVVHSTNNRSVIAGPGSGKTELLAQRAAYLLQVGIARPPRAASLLLASSAMLRSILQRAFARAATLTSSAGSTL
jgi:UvrD/REP helicase N-terminal domain